VTLISRYVAWKFHLPPAETYAVTHTRNLPVPMPDGTILLADHYFPSAKPGCPTVLIRSPYGRAGLSFDLVARPLAERGFQVLVQSCRGTFGSGGKLFPFRDEQADGLATIAWLRQQPWYTGVFAMFGPSYLSYVQWAVGDQAGPELKALIPIVTAAEFRSVAYPGEGFSLDTMVSWSQGMAFRDEAPLKMFFSRAQHARQLDKALMHLPLNQADQVAAGVQVDFYQEWLRHNAPGDPWWDEMDHRGAVSRVTVPVHLISGYYDVLFQTTLDCYQRLRQAGKTPYLTVGPWTHGDPDLQPVMMNETIHWLRAHLLDDRSGLRKDPVRVYVMGSGACRDFAAWPPPGYLPQPWYLQGQRGLSPVRGELAQSEPDRYRFDPADPTPSVGGTSLTANSGPRDNRKLESRQDVLVYTSAPLERDVEIIGQVRVELYVKSSLQNTDFFVRLCDVFPDGKSINLSDAIIRLGPEQFKLAENGILKVEFDLWPTANCFKIGHCVRVQVSSGSHPRYTRNNGSGEPLGSAVELRPADQQVFHDPLHPSAVFLPVKQD
jgi:putative CocE/NonD family hydrolase